MTTTASMKVKGWPVNLMMALVLAPASTACSFAFSEGPPEAHLQMPYFDCTSTYGLPAADGVFAVSGIASAVITFDKSKEEYAAQNNGASRNVAGGLNVVTAAVFGASAIYGVVQASRCTSAKEGLQGRIRASMLPPLPFRGPPTGASALPRAPSIPSGTSPAAAPQPTSGSAVGAAPEPPSSPLPVSSPAAQ